MIRLSRLILEATQQLLLRCSACAYCIDATIKEPLKLSPGSLPWAICTPQRFGCQQESVVETTFIVGGLRGRYALTGEPNLYLGPPRYVSVGEPPPIRSRLCISDLLVPADHYIRLTSGMLDGGFGVRSTLNLRWDKYRASDIETHPHLPMVFCSKEPWKPAIVTSTLER